MFLSSPARPRCLLVLIVAALALAQREVRVDDDDPSIEYLPPGTWFRASDVNPLTAGGFHMVTTLSTASATFRFTGTGISYMAPLWADVISTQVRLDGGVPVVIDLQDHTRVAETDGPTTVESSVLWSERGLENTTHTLVIDVPPGGGFAVVDMLVVEEAGDVTSSTDTTTADTAPTDTATSSSTRSSGSRTRLSTATQPAASPTAETKAGLSIALGTVGAVVGLLIIGGAIWYWSRRRQRQKEREAWERFNANPPPPPPMTEVNDGITALPKNRYRSIPSRPNMKASGFMDDPPDNMSQQSNMTTPSASAKQTSKLRQVVATEDGTKGRLRNTLYDASQSRTH